MEQKMPFHSSTHFTTVPNKREVPKKYSRLSNKRTISILKPIQEFQYQFCQKSTRENWSRGNRTYFVKQRLDFQAKLQSKKRRTL